MVKINKSLKIITVLFLILFIMVTCLNIIQYTKADNLNPDILLSYTDTNHSPTYSISMPNIHPSATTSDSSYGMTWRTENTQEFYQLTKITVQLSKQGSPTGFLRCDIYDVSGTYGNNQLPTGDILA